MREAQLQLVRDLRPILAERRLSSPAITYRGEAMFLAMPPGPPKSLKFGPGGFIPPEEGVLSQELWAVTWQYPETWPLGRYTCDVIVCNPDTWFEFRLEDVTYQHPLLQRLSDHEFLVGHGTSQPKDEGFHVYSSEGVRVRSAWFGDVEAIAVDDDGSVWATYHDESALSRLGSKALVQFDPSGAIRWSLNEHLDASQNVFVLQALTVSGGDPWGHDWSTNDVISAQRGVVRRWHNSIGSYDVGAIAEPYLVLVSDYWGFHLHRSARFLLARIEASQIVPVDALDIFLPSGDRVIDLDPDPAGRRPFDLVGRDGTLHVFTENSWYSLDVNTVADSRQAVR